MSDCIKARNGENKVQKLQRSLYVSAKQNPKRRYYSLYDKIYRKDVLWAAWSQVKANGGSPGIDGETIESIVQSGKEAEIINSIQKKLQAKTYKFSPVKEVTIPKANGGTRPLGIATVQDRIVQTAMKVVLEPIFEADFHECSYGYRPKRGAWRATKNILNDLYDKAWGVIEVDLKSYFMNIVHWKLMRLIVKRICDKSVLQLVKQSLKAPIARNTNLVANRKGVPQGSPISPLYSNIYLNVLDQVWHKREYPEKIAAKLHRYADDMILVCQKSSRPVMKALSSILERLDVEINESKTKETNLKSGFDFIGFEFVKRRSPNSNKNTIYLFPSKRAQKEIRNRIRKNTNRRAPVHPKDFILQINRITRGWAEYYRYTNGAQDLRRLQEFINRRTRQYLQYRTKSHSNGYTQYPTDRLYAMGLLQIHSGWVRPLQKSAHADT